MGAGINLFKQLFPEDYYAYQTATLISSKPVNKVIKDSNDATIATYALGGDEIRGLLKVENGNLVAFGDVHNSDGTGMKYFGIVDLSTQTWDISGNRCSITLNDIKLPANNDSLGNYICAYEEVTANSNIQAGEYAVFSYDNINKIVRFYYDGTLPSGYFIYELATPTPTTYTPFTNPMISGSTEEFTDSRSVKMPCGHDSYYGNDLTYAKADFGTTVYGGSIDFTTGTLISNKNADGTDKTPETISINRKDLSVRNGENYVIGDSNGNVSMKYYKKV